MKFNLYILLTLFLILPLLQISCSSGEYELSEKKVDYIIKIPVYDTLKINTDPSHTDIKDDKLSSYVYYVQIGAYATKYNFDKFFNDAKMNFGNKLFYEYNNGIYKIKIGGFSKKAECDAILQKAISLGYNDSFIIADTK